MDINNIMKNQPVINIGVIGHVSNGKSTIVKALTGKKTQQHSNEQERNITIKLGYANAKIYKCDVCESPQCYASTASNIDALNCKYCGRTMNLVNHISLVDAPGHHLLMSTMLNGTCVMDYTILVESLNNPEVPAPQTIEHVRATTLVNVPNKIICFNKLDLLKKMDAEKKIKEFKKQISKDLLSNSSIVPVVASVGLNMDVLCEELAKLEIPKHDHNSCGKMIVIRSFNANKPGTSIKNLKGGVIGGSLVKGLIKKNDTMILKPGFVSNNEKYNPNDPESKRWKYRPITTKIISIQSETNNLEMAIPGGLIGVQLDVDPALAANDGLIGNIAVDSKEENEYNVYEDVEIEFEYFGDEKKSLKNEKIWLNVNASNRLCQYLRFKNNKMTLKIMSGPICVKIGDQVTVSIGKNNNEGINVVGRGVILDGNCCENF
ncbi:eukaryotic translation initiation factor 2 gamma subunit [Catovirus CTV1]|uniref:Eukaryotic translation initiation factor 2 gamma subunit n=1 Tax=Catovirus CTV1 TaxID=1977631 RepID=A0A1V0SC62_9VIRU|nr:eukaryotic translation initiation factor 2 gamma subunit [Catovirus CTV1]